MACTSTLASKIDSPSKIDAKQSSDQSSGPITSITRKDDNPDTSNLNYAWKSSKLIL